jgi:putative phage-type endonuclease
LIEVVDVDDAAAAAVIESSFNKDAWLQERTKGIGGSEVAAALGLSRYKTPFDLYCEKTGLKDASFAPSWRTVMGKLMEPVLANVYQAMTGQQVINNEINLLTIHPEFPWARGTPDGWCPSRKTLVSYKTADLRMSKYWGTPGTDEVPEEYLLQEMYYLAIENAFIRAVKKGLISPDNVRLNTFWWDSVDEWVGSDVLVLIGGNDPRMYHIPRDEMIEEMVFEKVGALWGRIERQDPPQVDGSEGGDILLKSLFPKEVAGKIIEADDMVEMLVEQHRTGKEAVKIAEKQVAEADQMIMAMMGDAEQILGTGFKVLWKKPMTTDWKSVAEEVRTGRLDDAGFKTVTDRHTATNWKNVAEELKAPKKTIDSHKTIGSGDRTFRIYYTEPGK